MAVVKKTIPDALKELSPTLKPRDDAYKKKMDKYYNKRNALLTRAHVDDGYLGPTWNKLSKEIQSFRDEYEPAKIYSPREFLLDNYIDEFQIDRVRDDISLEDLWNAMKNGEDFYKYASVDGRGFDSEVREKIFDGIAELGDKGIGYDEIYNTWLYGNNKSPKKVGNPHYNIDNGNPNPKKDEGDEYLDKLDADPKYWASRVLEDASEYSDEEVKIAKFIANKWK